MEDAEWERSLFLQPSRLEEARKQLRPASRRCGGLLLAGLAAFAISVGEVRAENDFLGAGQETTVDFDYWAWLEAWFAGAPGTEETSMRNNEEGSGDPGEGD